MNLHTARTTLQTRPPKRFIELVAYEVLGVLGIAVALTLLLKFF